MNSNMRSVQKSGLTPFPNVQADDHGVALFETSLAANASEGFFRIVNGGGN
ncbi:MAG: hypothetical protein O2960_11185 [Verrucomicrobia bacterium]|nr:hypothetical protein [Verrucomicrobiota bacterium]